jgi:hypothetical protein
MEKDVVARASSTDQNDRALLEIRPARGMVREPTMGTKIVKRMIVCMVFVMIFKVYYIKNKRFVKAFRYISDLPAETIVMVYLRKKVPCNFKGNAL